MSIPIPLAQAVMITLSLLLIVWALRNGQRTCAALAAVALVLSLGLFGFGPGPGNPEPDPPDVGQNADFQARWAQNPDIWGQPLGNAKIRKGYWVTFYRNFVATWHHEIDDPNWRVQPLAAGAELMKLDGVPPDPAPITPPWLMDYLEKEGSRLGDLSYWVGSQLSNAVRGAGGYVYYFEKTIVRALPRSSQITVDDVETLPVGAMLLERERVAPSPWTSARKVLGGLATMALLVASIGAWWGQRTAFE